MIFERDSNRVIANSPQKEHFNHKIFCSNRINSYCEVKTEKPSKLVQSVYHLGLL